MILQYFILLIVLFIGILLAAILAIIFKQEVSKFLNTFLNTVVYKETDLKANFSMLTYLHTNYFILHFNYYFFAEIVCQTF